VIWHEISGLIVPVPQIEAYFSGNLKFQVLV